MTPDIPNQGGMTKRGVEWQRVVSGTLGYRTWK